MSVKGKVKRLNRQIEDLNEYIEDLEYARELDKKRHEDEKKELENLIKFFVVNQVGKPAPGGVHIENQYIDKLNNLDADVWYEVENHAYVIKLKEVGDE